MRIEEFEYYDKAHEWKLERVSFSDLTLLVGISGVGKTRILNSLLNVKSIAGGASWNGIRWDIVFTTKEGYRYRWSGKFETKENIISDEFDSLIDESTTRDKPEIISESLYRDEQEIIKRNQYEIILNGEKTPKLPPSSSVLHLLSQEESIQPASLAFQRILYSKLSFTDKYSINFGFDRICSKFNTLEKILESELGTKLKLALVYKQNPEVFAKIRTRFLEIFPQVIDLRVLIVKEEHVALFLTETPIIQIREKGVSQWIDSDKISSGMLRTICHLSEMYLWPEGTVILIDEFENSLGVNCIDVLTEELLQQHRHLQFIITSHHPYIINNIGPKYWKIVQRKRGIVSTQDASTLGLSDSSHEAFIQLINNDAYREGIAIR